MNIHSIYRVLFKIWRKKRMARFESIIAPTRDERILDVGGYPATWTEHRQLSKEIVCLNLNKTEWDSSKHPDHRITTTSGDGCSLQYASGSFDILFSNSVIEHVGDWEKQQAFAAEAMRVGKKLWIQTPSFWCPVEPHFLALGVHWLPVSIRRRVLRNFTLWGWLTRPSQSTIDRTIAFTQLLTKSQVQELFPECEVLTERLLGIFPKSYIVYRK